MQFTEFLRKSLQDKVFLDSAPGDFAIDFLLMHADGDPDFIGNDPLEFRKKLISFGACNTTVETGEHCFRFWQANKNG